MGNEELKELHTKSKLDVVSGDVVIVEFEGVGRYNTVRYNVGKEAESVLVNRKADTQMTVAGAYDFRFALWGFEDRIKDITIYRGSLADRVYKETAYEILARLNNGIWWGNQHDNQCVFDRSLWDKLLEQHGVKFD